MRRLAVRVVKIGIEIVLLRVERGLLVMVEGMVDEELVGLNR